MSDQAQRDQALDISQSFIVQAPAGSGKTELLTQRYLRLLSVCDEPENIVAMTFTNKAVDEMTQRVLRALKSSFKDKPEASYKQTTHELASQVIKRSDERGWQLLQNPKRLNITTIDGLYSLINNRYPSLSQLVPRQIMAESWARDNAYQYAAEQTLLMIDDKEHGGAIGNLLLHLDNNVDSFQKLIAQMLSKRDQWLTRLYRDDVLDVDVLKNNAKAIVSQHLKELQALAKPYLDAHFFALMSVSANENFAAVQSLPDVDCKALEQWRFVADLCLKRDGGWRKTLDKRNGFPVELKTEKKALIEFLKNLSEQEALREHLSCVWLLPDIDFSEHQADVLWWTAKVLKLSVAHLNVYFEREQAQDFIEVALNANQALDEEKGISDVALFLDYKVQHILVDEFQDTSASQFNTIEKLIGQWQENDGKTLFLVGDPMQSIYRFRESQVGLFLQVKAQGIANIQPKSLTLSTNFRSSKSIIASNNRFFSEIFPENNDVYQGAIAYSPSQSDPNSDPGNKSESAVVFHPFAAEQSLQEAQMVSEIVQNSIAKNPENTIAILVRTRSHLTHIAQQLRNDNIVFESVEITKLQDHLLTRDLFSLTKALLHLGDKLAWLSILRAPWCGLVLDDLLVLSESEECTIYQQLSDENMLARLSKDGQKRAQHLHHCLQDAINNQGRFLFVELLTHSINQLGLRNDALSNTELAIKNEFLKIVHHCETQQMLNVTTIQSAMKDLYAPSDKASVKLMTIHSSKGLEFDSVIIPGLGKGTRSDNKPIIQLHEFSNQSLLLAPIKSATEKDENQTYQYLRFIESQQSRFEMMRLLYVAMTRTKSQLHLLGAVNASGNSAKGSFLHLLMPFFAQYFDNIEQTPDSQQVPEAPLLTRFSHLATPNSKTQEQGESIEYQQNFERLFKSALGTLVHQYYEQQHFSPSIENVRARLVEIGTPTQEIEYWQAFIVKLLENTKNDEKFDWLFKDRELSLNEAEFVLGERTIAIDRLFMDDDGVLWVIDYKIAEPAQGESLASFIKHQQAQHAKQLLFYKHAMSEVYACPVRCALYCPSVSQLIEITDES